VTKKPRYLVNDYYSADSSAYVFNGRFYIYPSHDMDAGIPENDLGEHFDMSDYHVYSLDIIYGKATDHEVVLQVNDIPWDGRQLWAPYEAYKDGKYYFYFPLKEKNDIYRLGVAVSDKTEGPFVPQENPIKGSYSIDPAVLDNGSDDYYLCFGGLLGGQLQRYRYNKAIECGHEPAHDETAWCARVARLTDDMLESGGKTWLRSIKVIELEYNPDGSFVTNDGMLWY